MNVQGDNWNQIWKRSLTRGTFSYTDLPLSCRIQVYLENHPGVDSHELLSSLETSADFRTTVPHQQQRMLIFDELSKLVRFKRIHVVKEPYQPLAFYHTDPCLLPYVATNLHQHSIVGPKIFYDRKRTNQIDWPQTVLYAVRQSGASGVSNADLREIFIFFSPPQNSHGQITLYDHLGSLRRNGIIAMHRVYSEAHGLQYRYFPC